MDKHLINKGDKLNKEPHLEVYEGGVFMPEELVLVNEVGEDVPKYQYQAFYVVNGIHYYTQEENTQTE